MKITNLSHGWLLALITGSVATPSIGVASPTGITISGTASVIDGDTIDIRGERFRIEGIDAPESAQRCLLDDHEWPCGRRSAAALADFIGNHVVSCDVVGRDKYGRNLGRCRSNNRDIADFMTREGWAVAYRKYSLDYVASEDEAHLTRRNLWAGSFEAPWEYRHRMRGGPKP